MDNETFTKVEYFYRIESNVPIPVGTQGKIKYPFATMQVGDSFKAPVRTNSRLRAAVNQFCKYRQLKHNQAFKFVTRSYEGEDGVMYYRVWRIE